MHSGAASTHRLHPTHRQGHPAGCGNASYQPCHVALMSFPNSRHTTIIFPVPLGTCPTLAPPSPFSECADKTFVQATTQTSGPLSDIP